jgi:hypothetical protein
MKPNQDLTDYNATTGLAGSRLESMAAGKPMFAKPMFAKSMFAKPMLAITAPGTGIDRVPREIATGITPLPDNFDAIRDMLVPAFEAGRCQPSTVPM